MAQGLWLRTCWLRACCLAFFGFLRVAEFTCPTTFDPSTHLTPTDISFDEAGSIHLWLKTSKTDHFRQGVMLHIGSSGNPICPVVAMRSYLAIRGSPRDPYSSRRLVYHCLPPLSTTGYAPSSPQPGMGQHSAATVSVLGRLHPQQPRAFRITSSRLLAVGPATLTNVTFAHLRMCSPQWLGSSVKLGSVAPPFGGGFADLETLAPVSWRGRNGDGFFSAAQETPQGPN